MKKSACLRVLVLDVHARHSGFAVFEGPNQLVDWGMLHYGTGSNGTARPAGAQAAKVIARSQPERLVITMPANRTLAGNRLAAVAEAITGIAAQHHIPVRRLRRSQVLDDFGVRTRYAAAGQIAERFPSLGARLPRRRKIWQSEQPIMSVFDAAAAALAYYRRYSRLDRSADPLAA